MLKSLKNVIYGYRKIADKLQDYQEIEQLLMGLPGDTEIIVDCSFYEGIFKATSQKVFEFVQNWFNPTPNSSESTHVRHRVYRNEENTKHRVDLKQTSLARTIKGSLEFISS